MDAKVTNSDVRAVTVAMLMLLAGRDHHTLAVAAWGLVIAVLVIAGIGLTITITGIEYLTYRRRRADLDAAGAEAIGELNARLHRPKDL